MNNFNNNHVKFLLWNKKIYFNSDFVRCTVLSKFGKNNRDISHVMDNILCSIIKNIIIIVLDGDKHKSYNETLTYISDKYLKKHLSDMMSRLSFYYFCETIEEILDTKSLYYKCDITYFELIIRMLLLSELF